MFYTKFWSRIAGCNYLYYSCYRCMNGLIDKFISVIACYNWLIKLFTPGQISFVLFVSEIGKLAWFACLVTASLLVWDAIIVATKYVIKQCFRYYRFGSRTAEPSGGKERKLWDVIVLLHWWHHLVNTEISVHQHYTTLSYLEAYRRDYRRDYPPVYRLQVTWTQWAFLVSILSGCNAFTVWSTWICYLPLNNNRLPHLVQAQTTAVQAYPQLPALHSSYHSADSRMHSSLVTHTITHTITLPLSSSNKIIDCWCLLWVKRNIAPTHLDIKLLSNKQTPVQQCPLSNVGVFSTITFFYFWIFFRRDM